ncbi:anti-anti-sigma factor [Actinacidiphila yanglinensis]|uniref:Anti-anti-sigma factor n=1 Tax=Actinacidiphila yanglinensis TaxID=310779 RepID=A0A1H6DH78_9ACTN|nr:STAS domain-containing protein [Actinacidiphila yanglinensis]SEG84531.1 anti-anti-sigma factor [Actinacidiphila yanglinensis]
MTPKGAPTVLITTSKDGVAAVISPSGEIDFDTLPGLLAAEQELPQSVRQVTWDLRDAVFMDVAGLHLLFQQRLVCWDRHRTLIVTGLQKQPIQLLQLAEELFPAGHWSDFLPASRPASAA